MPRLPTYELSVTPQTNLVTPDFSHKGGLGAMGREVGKVLQVRGKQLTGEYDTVKAVGAFNAFSDSSREMVKGLLKLESGAAEGAQGAYKEWYGKNQNEFTGMLNSQPQQAMYKQLADRKRETDLNHLARHEATQYKIQKKEALDGHATNADLAIREATTEALKTPGKDFMAADMVIEDFLTNLESMFPGHDLKALRAKYTQTLRIAQMEEMMEVDPQTAREMLEKYKDDLSFVENGILKDAYPALKSKLKEEVFKDDVDRAYHAQVALHPTDPETAIKGLTPERMKELEIDVAAAQRVKNIFKGEIQWAENRAEDKRKDAADISRNNIMEFLQTGDISSAFKELYDADHLSPGEQQIMYNIITQRTSQFTDTELSNQIDEDIISGKITRASQISRHKKRGLSDADTAQKQAMLKDHLKNPATMQFLNEAFVWYDGQFEDDPDNYILMLEMRPYIKSEIMRQINDPKINLKGPDILPALQEMVGSREDLYREGFFSFLGYGEEKTKAPAQEMVDKARKEKAERTKRHAEGVTVETVGYAEIPGRAVIEIRDYLKKIGKDTSEKSIVLFYQKNKDKLPKDDIGVTF